MAWVKIRLNDREWSYDPSKPLGPEGGFGEVFVGKGAHKEPVAVKRLKVGAEQAAHRELRMAEILSSRNLEHVVPVLDAGQDALSDSYFIVMPRAHGSLQDELSEDSSVSLEEALGVLTSIALGLQEVSEVTHRDLKPGNVLLLDGRWCVSDFGIARFVEETTSEATLRGFLTPAYAAPEQWREETATGAADLYALGCIAHTLISGRPPYSGPSAEDYQRQHLEDVPPELPTESSQLRGLVSMLLRKNHLARPSLPRVLYLLLHIAQSPGEESTSPEEGALSKAGAAVAAKQAEAEALKEAEERAYDQRRSLAEEAVVSLKVLMDRLFNRIKDQAPIANVGPTGSSIALGDGYIEWSIVNPIVGADAFSRSGWNVIAGAFISVSQKSELYGGRSASLWFTDVGTGGELRWYEVTYMTNVFAGKHYRDEPMALALDDADGAAATGITEYQFAAPLVPVDDEDFEPFARRWIHRLASAAQSQLQRPQTLPETLGG